jgi:hypothetical protein
MRAAVLDGGTAGDRRLDGLREALGGVLAAAGWTAKVLALERLEVGRCSGCFGCWVRTPGECVVQDDAGRVTEAIVDSDLTVLLTPVTFGGYSSLLKRVLDRQLCLVSPFYVCVGGETHHARRYERYPALAGLGAMVAPDPEAESIFKALVGRNALNLHAPCHAAAVFAAAECGPDLERRLGAALQSVGVSR